MYSFIDTNVLVYADAADAADKQACATALIAEPLRAGSVLEALDLHTLHKVSFRDALILQAARQSGCVQLLTEDLQTNAMIGGVRIVNPFDGAAKPRGSKRR